MTTVKLINEESDFDISISIKDNWNEISLDKYLDLVKIIQDKEKYEDEEFFLKMILVLSDAKEEDLLEIPVSEFNKLIDIFNVFATLKIPDLVDDYIIIDDVIYVPKKNLTNLTTSEVIYIKTIQKNSKETIDIYLGILSILLRPGYKKEEGGKTRYIQYKLNDEDIEHRKIVFRDKLMTSVAIPLIKSFMNGTTK